MNSQSDTELRNARWMLLGELELSLSDGQDQAIHEWLNRILEPLKLHEDIFHKIRSSLQEAARRAQDTHAGKKMQHIHFRIHVQGERTSKGHTWGFFQVDKSEKPLKDGQLPDHATELYLYLDGTRR